MCNYPTAEHRNYYAVVNCTNFLEDWLDIFDDILTPDTREMLRLNCADHLAICNKFHGYAVGTVLNASEMPQAAELLPVAPHWIVCNSIFSESENFFDIHPLNAEESFMSDSEWHKLYE